MAPKKTMKDKSGFFGVRQKPSGNWGVELSDVERRWWIGTYPSAHEAARAYDLAVWRAERPREHLNFPEIVSRVEAEMLVPQGINMKEITTKKKTTKKPSVVVNADETDEEAMARFAREHPNAFSRWSTLGSVARRRRRRTSPVLGGDPHRVLFRGGLQTSRRRRRRRCDDQKEEFGSDSAPTMRSSLSSSLK
ncbi:hypothetical protein ZWY2020_047189 [Hordeum vulgare]|nr:hypothetical protein ZWY2020_047189 [Hordeum vulgare]